MYMIIIIIEYIALIQVCTKRNLYGVFVTLNNKNNNNNTNN